MIQEKDVQITVRDGTKIAVRIYRPDGSGRVPALFAPSPYRYDNNELPASAHFLWRETGPIDWYVEQGYAYVHADVRGTGFSEGEFGLLDRKEQCDLYDVIEWIAAQPWSNGKVGGIGQSYFCMSQWFMGIMNPPHLACLGAYDGMTDVYRYMGCPGGMEGNFAGFWYNSSVRIPNLYPANGAHPRYVTTDLFLEILRHPLYDDFWKERCAVEQLDKIKVPLYVIGVWAKNNLHLPSQLLGYLRAQGTKKLAILGTPTPFTAMTDFAGVELHRKYLLPFYDKFLKGLQTDWDERPAVQYEVHNTRKMYSLPSWPPPAKMTPFYLGKGPTGSVTSLNDGSLNAEPSDAAGGSTTYSYPHPDWTTGPIALGPQGPDPVRAVLTFTTEPLADDVEIGGHPKLVLYASSTRNDMDFMVKLSEQFAQSPADRNAKLQPQYRIVTRGWHRASHMDRDPRFDTDDVPYYTHERVTPLTPGEIYQIEIALHPIAYRFSKGNRIRLEIVCDDSPMTDLLWTHLYRPDKIGADTIVHDANHQSRLILPIVE